MTDSQDLKMVALPRKKKKKKKKKEKKKGKGEKNKERRETEREKEFVKERRLIWKIREQRFKGGKLKKNFTRPKPVSNLHLLPFAKRSP
jgi:hypothetical protein